MAEDQIKIYNQDGNVTEEIKAPAFLLTPWNTSLVHQIYKSYAANRQKPIAHTKNRGEVSGGGIKPWRQKGTGRARHGSTRSPLWRHGGVTFGPRNTTIFSQKINKKMARNALFSALAKKFSTGYLKILDNVILPELKTKKMAHIINNLNEKKSTLFVVAKDEKNFLRAAANIANINGILTEDLNVYDVLNNKYIIMDKKALEEIKL